MGLLYLGVPLQASFSMRAKSMLRLCNCAMDTCLDRLLTSEELNTEDIRWLYKIHPNKPEHRRLQDQYNFIVKKILYLFYFSRSLDLRASIKTNTNLLSASSYEFVERCLKRETSSSTNECSMFSFLPTLSNSLIFPIPVTK